LTGVTQTERKEQGVDDRCEYCGGELFELGILGDLLWVQCRDCGLEMSMLPEGTNHLDKEVKDA